MITETDIKTIEDIKSDLKKKVPISRVRARTYHKAEKMARHGQSARRAGAQAESKSKGNKIMSTMKHMPDHYADVDRYGMDVGGMSISKRTRKGI